MQDKVRELKDRLKNLSTYVNGLAHVKKLAEDAIRDTKWNIRKVCKHDNMEYTVGEQTADDPDDGAEFVHCKYCGVCETLFVIRPYKYGEYHMAKDKSRVRLNDFFYNFYIDKKTMSEE